MTLAERKRLLIAESDYLRGEISRQLDAIQESVSWVETGIRTGRAVSKGAPLVGILGGLFLAWKTLRGGKAAAGAGAATVAEEEPSLLSTLVTRGIQVANFVGPIVSMFRTKPSA